MLAAGLAGCGESTPDDGPKKDEVVAAAEALVRALSIEGGTLRDGALPETDAPDVTLEPLDGALVMQPGQAGLMSLAPDNPDEAEDPVQISLLQFALVKKHFEVERPSEGEQNRIEHAFTLSDDVCDSLCNREFRLEVHEKLQLRSGKIGQRATRTVILDCTEDGDPKACTGDSGDAGEGGAGGGGAGEGGTGGDAGEGGTGGGNAGTGGTGGSGDGLANAECDFTQMSTDPEAPDASYRVSYDADGRLSTFEYLTQMTTTTYTYDADGRIVLVVEENNVDGSSETTTLTYDANGLVLTELQESSEAGDEAELKTYTYDADGNRIARDSENAATGDLSEQAAYTYDSDGLRTSIEYDNTGVEGVPDGSVDSRTDYTYDADGHVSTERTQDFDIEGVVTDESTITYEYDDAGHLVVETRETGGAVEVVKMFTYDAAGNLVSEVRDYPSDPASNRTISITYDCDFTLFDACGGELWGALADLVECPDD